VRVLDRLYALALRAYPADFRLEHEEEMFATLAEMRDAGEPLHPVCQIRSLLFDGSRHRWLRSTEGALGPTVRQGLAWGVLVLVARQAGLAVYDLVQPFVRGWEDPFTLTYLLLAMGWVLTFCLLAAGRRRWGLVALSVVISGFVVYKVELALSYPGPFSWPFTLHFFLPAILPLLAAYAWPSEGVKLPAWSWLPILALASLIPPLSMLPGPVNEATFPYWSGGLALAGACVVLLIVAFGLSDPRWTVAVALVFSVFGGKALVAGLTGSSPIENALKILAMWIAVPAVAVLVARRVRRTVRT
jgi:hypothetical protein